MAFLITNDAVVYIIVALVILFLGFVIGLFTLTRKQLVLIESRFGPVVPLWKHALSELSAIMRHPHEWALELDDLLEEANLEPEVPMEPEKFRRLLELLSERALSTNPELREGEKDAAHMYLLALKFAKKEAENPIELTGIRLVGTQAPKDISKEDEKIREPEFKKF